MSNNTKNTTTLSGPQLSDLIQATQAAVQTAAQNIKIDETKIRPVLSIDESKIFVDASKIVVDPSKIQPVLDHQLLTGGLGRIIQPELDKIQPALDNIKLDVDAKINPLQNSVDEIKDVLDGLDIEAMKNFFAAAEAERLKKEKVEKEDAEKNAKFFNMKNLKIAGMVVGGIVLIAGVAYVVRKVFFSPSGEIEGIDAEVATSAPDLEMVANY